MTPEILLCIIKLGLGGLVAFFAILLMSKTRSFSWICMVCGFLFSYAAIIYEILIQLGILAQTTFCLFGIPLSQLICTVVPSIFYILAFILMLCKK